MQKQNWSTEPLRIAAVQCNYGEDSHGILERHVASGMFNTEQLLHLNAVGHTAFYKHERDAEKLRVYLQEAHKRNVRVILYWNTHCIEQPERDLNPEYVQHDSQGKEITAYTNKYLVCINSPWVDDFYANLELVCDIGPDGIFLDGPVVGAQGCYCPSCQALYREETGRDLLAASHAEMLAFKVRSVTRYVRRAYEIKLRLRPEMLIYLNNSALRPDVTGSNTTEVEPYVDMLGAEAGFAYIRKSYEIAEFTSKMKYIETKAKGKPYVCFVAGDSKPSSYHMHTAAETRILYWRTVANGANIWYGIHAPTWIMTSPGGRAAYACNRFLARNPEVYRGTSGCGRIALVWSQNTANHYGASIETSDFTQARRAGLAPDKGDHARSFAGFAEVLLRKHLDYAVIDETVLAEADLAGYELIILPVAACLSDAVIARLQDYVRKGGRLIATYDSGRYDEKGQLTAEDRLAGLLGVRRGATQNTELGMGFFRLNADLTRSLAPVAEILPTPGRTIICQAEAGTEVLARVSEPMASRYVDFPPTDLPFLTVRPEGKGEVLYCSGTLDEGIRDTGYADWIDLMAGLIRRYATPLVETSAPASVELMVRRLPEGRGWILHLINMTGEMIRPIRRLIPLPDVKIKLRLPDRIRSVQGLRPDPRDVGTPDNPTAALDHPDDRLALRWDESAQEVTIEELNDYAVLILNP